MGRRPKQTFKRHFNGQETHEKKCLTLLEYCKSKLKELLAHISKNSHHRNVCAEVRGVTQSQT